MGRRGYPSLTPGEVCDVLQALGFSFKRQKGSHRHYERAAEGARLRTVVTVDMAVAEFWSDLMKSMVRQSGFDRDAFYSATKATKKKL